MHQNIKKEIVIRNYSPAMLELIESILVLENTHYSLSVIMKNLIEKNKIQEGCYISFIQGDIQMLEEEIYRLREVAKIV